MESIQTKIRLKKKKKIMNIINDVFYMDETTINFSGDKKNGKSIFFPKTLIERSILSTPLNTFGTKSQFSKD